MRRLVIFIVVLVGLFAVADFGTRAMAEKRIAQEVAAVEPLATDPQVDIQDPIFLLAAAKGRFEQVDVTSGIGQAEGVGVRSLVATLSGVEVPVREVLSGTVPSVHVAAVSGQASVDWADIARVIQAQAQASGSATVQDLAVQGQSDGTVLVTGTVDVLGAAVALNLPLRVGLDGGQFVLSPAEQNSSSSLPVDELFTVRIPIPELPYGLKITDLRSSSEGLQVLAEAKDVTVN